MAAVEIAIFEPVLNALSTSAGWIGLLLGLGGRETARALKRIIASFRGE